MTTVASLAVEITGDISGLDRAMRGADDAVKNFGQRMGGGLKKIGDNMTTLGTSLLKITAPLVAFGTLGVHTAATFESSMNEISARTGLVGEDLEKVRQYALKMGADTSFSAQQAADAFLQLLSSGSSASEAIATLPTVLNLAAASGLDLGYSADLVTDVMKQFGIEIEHAADVSDALVKAAGSSSATVASLADGMANVGPVAAMLGMSIEETAAALATLSENGIKGAEAGTALRTVLRELMAPNDEQKKLLEELGVTVFDATGKFRGLDAVVDDLNTALGSLTPEEQAAAMQTLAGAYGITALSALLASNGIDGMLASMEQASGAADVADARMKGFAGAFESLKGSVETVMIEAMTPFMNNVLTPLVEKLTPIINSIAAWAAANPELVSTIAAVVAVVATLGAGLTAAGVVISSVGTAMGVLGGAVAAVNLPLVTLVAAIGLLVTTANTLLPQIVESWGEAFRQIGIFIDIVIGKVESLIAKIGEAANLVVGGWASGIDAILNPYGAARRGGQSTYEFQSGYMDNFGGTRQAGQQMPVPGMGNVPPPNGSNRSGLDYVPYDGYMARLHRGEQVLTENEARGRGSQPIVVNVTAYGTNEQEFAEMVRRALAGAAR